MRAPTCYVNRWNWDVLIVLDACRRDYFVKVNDLKGKLTNIDVESCDTLTWLTMNFPLRYSYVYVSGNPYCNSKIKIGDWFAPKHFKKVVDVWDFGWDERLMTVPPDRITESALPYVNRERTIVHYMQPHFPTIGKIKLTLEAWRPNPLNTVIEGKTYPQPTPSINLIREAYEENLSIVLNEVKSNLLTKIRRDRTVVITSDHGELLGEYGYLCHPVTNDQRIVRILGRIFWFKVQR